MTNRIAPKDSDAQTHIDSWGLQEQEDQKPGSETYDISDMPVGLNRQLFKTFEKFRVGDKTILCVWKNGRLNSAIRPVVREHELMALAISHRQYSTHPMTAVISQVLNCL